MSTLPLRTRGLEGAALLAPAFQLDADLAELALDECTVGRAFVRRADAAELPTLAEQRAHRRLRRGVACDLRTSVRGAA